MSLSDDVLCAELQSIIAYAKTQGITGKWLQSLQARVRAYRSPGRRRLKTAIRRIRTVWGLLTRGEVRELTTRIFRKLKKP